MSHTFVSYSRRDKETVDRVVGSLEKAGVAVWLDREDIKTGESWRVQIVEAIDECDAFVLMLSANSAASENVHKEVILAADSGRKIFVMALEPVKIPAQIRYQLAGLQFIEAHTIGFEKGVEQLTADLKEHLKKTKRTGDNANRQMELVIQGVNLSQFNAEKQEQLLAFIASLAGTERNQLNIANMTVGSVHVVVDMPAAVAHQLKTLALNSDPRFAAMGIVSLRMTGDAHYIHIARGRMMNSATQGANLVSPVTLSIAALILIVIAVWMFFPKPSSPLKAEEPTASSTPEGDQATPTFTPTGTSSPTPTNTATPSSTPTATPVEYQILEGVIANNSSACNYGPGNLFLNDESLRQGIKLEVLGRDANSAWAYVHADGYPEPCWVDLKNIKLEGEVSDLEPVYPGKVTVPPSAFWPPPENVASQRNASDPNQLTISWEPFILEDGDLEYPGAPRYLLELWLCQDGRLTFSTLFAWDSFVTVTDETGCSEPSRGYVYLAEKHGYPGPVEIPWERHP